jgi:hypothetical protein
MSEVPTNVDGITADWLHPHMGRLDDIRVAEIGQGFSFGGTTFRVDHAHGSVIVKLASAERTLREQAFYEQCAPTTPIGTPALFGADADGNYRVLILEFVVDARQGDVLKGCSAAEMIDLASTIGRVHGTWWGHSDGLTGLGPRPRFALAPDRLSRAIERFDPPASFHDRMADLPARLSGVYDELAA